MYRMTMIGSCKNNEIDQKLKELQDLWIKKNWKLRKTNTKVKK